MATAQIIIRLVIQYTVVYKIIDCYRNIVGAHISHICCEIIKITNILFIVSLILKHNTVANFFS